MVVDAPVERGDEGGVLGALGGEEHARRQLLRQALRDPGFPVHWGSGDELSRHLPLGHVLDCLEVDVPVPAQPATAGPERESDPLLGAMEQVLGLVDQLCSAGPAAIVLDDLQWADEATLLVLHRLVGAIGQLPLLLVGVCRTAPRPPELDRIRDLIDATGGAVIQLEPLDNAAAGQLVEAELGAKPDAAAQSLFERAGGNPLFLREMVAALRHCGLRQASPGMQ